MTQRPERIPLEPQYATLIRIIGWAVATLSTLGFVSLYLAASSVQAKGLVAALFAPLPVTLAVITGAFAWRSSLGKRRRLWRLFTISMALFLMGIAYRSIMLLLWKHYPAPGSFATASFVLALLTLVPVTMLMTEPFEVVNIRKVRGTLDFFGMMLAIFSISLIFVLEPLEIFGPSESWLHNFAFAIYPTASLAFPVYLLTFKRTRWRSPDRLAFAAFVIGAVGITSAMVGTGGSYSAGTTYAGFADGVIAISFMVFALAGLHAWTLRESATVATTPQMDLPHLPAMITLAVGLVAIPLLVMRAAQLATSFDRVLVSSAAAVLGAVIVARSAVVTLENRSLASKSTIDPLTGLFNHMYFRTRLAEECFEALAAGSEITLCVFDLDGFDSFNSSFGYRRGDARLRAIGRIISGHTPEGIAFRVGGDEFAVLLTGDNVLEAHEMCSQIALDVRKGTSSDLPEATMSIGIATLPLHASNPDLLVRYAFGARYWAQRLGGNQIVMFDPEVVVALDSRQHVDKIEEESHLRLVEALAAAVDARDAYTRHHSANVAFLSQTLARAAGLSDARVREIHSAALLHDVGKIGIPDSILRKPGRLDDAEYEQIKEHPSLGARILGASTSPEVLQWILFHHERWDGNGYPRGISGAQIPYEARILAICDAYDAMTSDRPYRRGMPVTDALDELAQCAGTQFDPELVDVFVDALIASWPQTRFAEQSTAPDESPAANARRN